MKGQLHCSSSVTSLRGAHSLRVLAVLGISLIAVTEGQAARALPYGPPGVHDVTLEAESLRFEGRMEFGSDSLLVVLSVPALKYREEHRYFGSQKRVYSGVPRGIQDMMGPVRPLNRFEGFFSDTPKVWGVGTPNAGLRLHNFAVVCTSLTRGEYEAIRMIKSIAGSPDPPEDAADMFMQYCETDYRDANTILFLRYRSEQGGSVVPDIAPQPDKKNDSNRTRFTTGTRLPLPATWPGIESAPDTLSLYGDSPYWFQVPGWWNPPSGSGHTTSGKTAIWQNDGEPWSQGLYVQYDGAERTVYYWKWRRQWYRIGE